MKEEKQKRRTEKTEALIFGEGDEDPNSHGMVFVPQIRPLALKRPNIRQGLLTPRKCTVFVIILLLLAVTFARIIWGMKHVYVEYHALSDTDGELTTIPVKFASERGAYCLDGSPPGYYSRKGTGSGENNWIILLQGGAWCYDINHCEQRSRTVLGSSRVAANTIPFEGLLSSDVNLNPEFHNWNMVVFLYCDGASFAGNLSSPVNIGKRKLYFKGFPVLLTLTEFLLEEKNLNNAENVLLSGPSAGGLAVYLHADYIRSKLPSTVKFKALADGGFFMDSKDCYGDYSYRKKMQKVFQMQNVQGALSVQKCISQMAKSEQWKCIFPQHNNIFIETPLFIANSDKDSWSVWNILNVSCGTSCNETMRKEIQRYQQETVDALKNVTAKQHGIFLTPCSVHTVTNSNDIYYNMVVKGNALNQTVGDWYFDRKTDIKIISHLDDSKFVCS